MKGREEQQRKEKGEDKGRERRGWEEKKGEDRYRR